MKPGKLTGKQKLPVSYVAAKLIAGVLDRIKHLSVGVLKRAEQRCTQAQKKVLFFAFCFLFGGYCIYLLFGSAGKSISPSTLRQANGSPPLALPPPKVDTTVHSK